MGITKFLAGLVFCWIMMLGVVGKFFQTYAAQETITDGLAPDSIKQRALSLPPVSAALNDILSHPSGDWHHAMLESSFHQWVKGDVASRSKAINLFVNHTKGDNRFSFAIFATKKNKYMFSQQCASLALSYSWLYPYLSDAERQAGSATLKEWGTGLYNYYRNNPGLAEHNFHTGSVACLGLIGLTLDDEVSAASKWWQFAMKSLQDHYYNFSYNPGGDYWEGYHYRLYGSGPAIMFAVALKSSKQIDVIQHTNMSQLWQFNIQAYGASADFPRYGDNTKGIIFNGEDLYLIPYLSAPTAQANALWIWKQVRGNLADQGSYNYDWKEFDRIGIALFYPSNVVARAPEAGSNLLTILPSKTSGTEQGSVSQPGGMASFHSGWNPSSSMSLWLVNRWRWQSHQYYDPNHFELSAYGKTLFGSENNWSYQDKLRGKLSQHNTVLIDPNSWYGDAPTAAFYTGAAASLGKFTDSKDSNWVAVLTSDARYPMANFSTQKAPNGGYRYFTTNLVKPITQADRTVVFSKSMSLHPFTVIFDQYQRDDNSHQYRWQAYIPGSASITGGAGTASQPYQFSVGGVKLKSIFMGNASPTLSLAARLTGRGDKALQVDVSNVVKGEIVSILLPEKSGINFETRQISSDPQVVEINDGGTAVRVIFAGAGQGIHYNGIVSDARVVILSVSGDEYKKYVLLAGRSLKINGKQIYLANEIGNGIGEVGGRVEQGCSGGSDLNNDGQIDLTDYTLLSNNWFKSGVALTGDIDCSGVVDLSDYSILSSGFSL